MIQSQTLQLRCGDCRALFEEESPVNVRIELWTGWVQAIRCPACGSSKILMGQGRSRSEDAGYERGEGLAMRAAMWERNGETEQSSRAILERMQGKPHPRTEHPHDVADLRRCVLLLDRIPEWRARMPEMAQSSEAWGRFARAWETLVALFEAEAGPNLNARSAPRTAALVSACADGEETFLRRLEEAASATAGVAET